MAARDRQSLGQLGEDLACAELERRGYAVLARRFRTRLGEIDIIATHGATLVFVEVKARADLRFGGAAAAVTRSKQRRVARIAELFLGVRRLDGRACRFDVVTVELAGSEAPRVEVYESAFALS